MKRTRAVYLNNVGKEYEGEPTTADEHNKEWEEENERRTFTVNIMKLIKGLESRGSITINDEESLGQFISYFKRYEGRVDFLPDYKEEKEK